MIILQERYDSKKLIQLFDNLVAKGSTPMWVDPYCEFVCLVNNKNYRFVYEPDTNRIYKELIDVIPTRTYLDY